MIRLQSDTSYSFNRYTNTYNISVPTNKGNVEANLFHIEPHEHTFQDRGDIYDDRQRDSYLPSSAIPYQPNSNCDIISHINSQAAKTRIPDYHHFLKSKDKVNYQPTSEISYAQISKHVSELRLNPTGSNFEHKFMIVNFNIYELEKNNCYQNILSFLSNLNSMCIRPKFK